MDSSLFTRVLAALLPAICAVGLAAQSNGFGTVHLSAGFSTGVYGTRYSETFLGVRNTNDDGAVSVSVPLEVHVGLVPFMSLGLYLQPGYYLDSSATRNNSFFIAGLSPRFYIVNGDRFNWFAGLEAGLATLIIEDKTPSGSSFKYTFAGGHFRLGSGFSYYFGNVMGMQAQLKYANYPLPLQDIEPNISGYGSKLEVKGFEFQIGLTFKLGGG